MDIWNPDLDKFTYILRYYLPCMPQYDESVSISRLNELIEFCLENKVDAVMLYVDLNPYWYYMPDTIEHNDYLAEFMVPFAKRLRDNNISYQLNYQNLFGSWDANFDHRKLLDWECYVDEFGRKSMGCACMIGEKFRKIASHKLKRWAMTMPDVIWIDDDIRLHNHRTGIHDFWNGVSSAEGLDFGCFCDEHISLFNKKYNMNVTRDEIVSSIVNKNVSQKLGDQYRAFLDGTLSDTAKWIEETVHSVSPNTRLALMSSNPDVHTMEGRDWGRLFDNLCKDHVPVLRPTYGPYYETDPRDFAESYRLIRQACENIQSSYGKKVDFYPEIENTRFTVYSKSLAATAFQIDLSAFFGFGGVTLSIFDLEGVKLNEEPEFGDLLSSHKDFCDILSSLDTKDFVSDGIAFISSSNRYAKRDGAARISDLLPPRQLDKLIAKAGIAYTYIAPENISKAAVLAIDEYSASLLSDAEIKLALSKPLIMDSGAAMLFYKRGFGKYLGVVPGDKIPCIAASEMFNYMTRTDKSKLIIPSRICGNSWRELKLNGANSLSMLSIPDGTMYPNFCIYENSLAGKLCIYAPCEDYGDGFFSNYRIRFLKDIIDELYPNTVRADFKSYGLLAVRKKDNKQLIFITNLSADVCLVPDVRLDGTPKKITAIKTDGTKIDITPTGNALKINGKLSIYSSIVLYIEY